MPLRKPDCVRFTVILSLVTAVSLLTPALCSRMLDASLPRFSPEQFNLPPSAREVVSKRTDKTATFEVGDGKYAQVSGIERAMAPQCQSWLCSMMTPVRKFLPSVFATTAGPNSPGTVVDDNTVGSMAWSNPSQISASDTNYAVVSCWSYGQYYYSHYLNATNFNFSIPVGSTVNGIAVDIQRYQSGYNEAAQDSEIKIIKEGVIGSTNRSVGGYWRTTPGYDSFGSSSDLWGETWTSANINSANFGVVLSAKFYILEEGNDANVDHIRITVYYTEAATPVPFFSWWSVPLLILGLAYILKKEILPHLTHSHERF